MYDISFLCVALAYSVMISNVELLGPAFFIFDCRNISHFNVKYPEKFRITGSVEAAENRYTEIAVPINVLNKR